MSHAPKSGAVAPPDRTVAIVLPPREGFSPDAVGAVGLLAHRVAGLAGPFRSVVVGAAPRGVARGVGARPPFTDVLFQPAPTPFWPLGRTARYASGVAQVLQRLRPSLVEVHNRPEVALLLAGRLPDVRIALFLHNDPQGMSGARSPADRVRLLDRLAGIAAVSGFLRDRFLDGTGQPANRVAVLPNCIDLSKLPPPLPPTMRQPVVLFAGRMVADKGADVFVRAWSQIRAELPTWRARMIGADRFRPDSPQTPFLRALLPEAQAVGIALTGYQPHTAVLDAMASSAIVTVPSRWQEPFGLTALEAMACGAPLVCTRRGGLPEVAGEAAVYVPHDDPAALAAALRALATDARRRVELSQAGRARAALFDLAPAAARLTAFREELLGS